MYIYVCAKHIYIYLYLSIHRSIHTSIRYSLSIYTYIHLYISTYLSVYLHPYRLPTHVLTCMSISRTSTCETLFSKKELSLLNIYTNYINLSLSLCMYIYVCAKHIYICLYLSIHRSTHTSIRYSLSIDTYIHSYISLYLSVYLHPYRLSTHVLTCMSMSRSPRVRRYSARRS